MNHQAIRKFFVISRIRDIKRTLKNPKASKAKIALARKDLEDSTKTLINISEHNELK